MRASLRSMPCFIASLALCFAIGTALPTRAFADVIDIVDGYSYMQYQCLDIDTEPTSAEIDGNGIFDMYKTSVGSTSGEIDLTNTGYMASSQGGAISLAGTVNQNNGATSLTGMYTDTSHDISIDTAGYTSSQIQITEMYRSADISLSGVPSRPYMFIMLRAGQKILTNGDRFKLIIPGLFEWEYISNGRNYVARSGFSNVSVWASSSANANTAVKLSQDSTGYYEVQGNTQYIYIVFRPQSTAMNATRLNSPNSHFRFYNPFKVYAYLPNEDIENLNNQTIVNTQNITNKITQQTQQQTTELKDTTGSDSVISGTDGVNQQIQSKLGFIAETATITSNLYDAILYEGDGYVPFPEVAWDGHTIIAAQNVPILGYMPSIEDDIKDFNTVILFLAWLHGMHSLYARIFLGQVEVISEDD